MNLTYLRIDLVRQLRNIPTVVFVIALPVLMFTIFGNAFGGEVAGRGNTQFYIMVSMACYGAATATTSVTGAAATELLQGWGRQLALTPLRPAGYVATKVAVALVAAATSVAAVFLVGIFVGSQAEAPRIWVASALIAWLGSVIFALYGLAVVQLVRSETAVSVSSASLVLLAFLGNMFLPLSGTMLAIAKFTPMYGFVSLARWPQLEGHLADVGGGRDPLWLLLVNVGVWLAVFAGVAGWAVRRGRRRQ
jgi:ABC-2 type transport system permease protein